MKFVGSRRAGTCVKIEVARGPPSRPVAAVSIAGYALVRVHRNCFAYHFAQSRDLNIGCNLERRSTPRRLRLHYSASPDALPDPLMPLAPLRFHRLVSPRPFARHTRPLFTVPPASMNLIFIRRPAPVSRSSLSLFARRRRKGNYRATTPRFDVSFEEGRLSSIQ